MSKIKVEYLHLCDAANVDNFGKINILGIFTKMYVSKVPNVSPKFTVVGNLIFDHVIKDRLKVEIKFYNPSKKEVELTKEIKTEIDLPEVTQKSVGNLNIILDILNLKLNEFGDYKVSLFVDNVEVDSITFNVEQRKENLKQ